MVGRAKEVLAGPRLCMTLVQLGGLFENWKKAGWESPEFTVTFLRSDDEFDKFVSRMHADGITVVIDPLMSLNREIIKGSVIQDLYEAISSGAG